MMKNSLPTKKLITKILIVFNMKMIGFKVTEEQKQQLHKDAEENGLTVSEYIKIRLFEERTNTQETNEKLLSHYEKNLVSVAIKNYYMSQLLAKKIANEDEIANAINKANKILEEKGYLNKNTDDKC